MKPDFDKKYFKQCKYCKSVVDKQAKICPFCRKRLKEGAGSMILFIIIVLSLIFCCTFKIGSGSNERTSTPSINHSNTAEVSTSNLTMGQQNALRKAKSYLETTSFSYSGLVSQLEFEGYSHDDAIFGASNCGADWNQQAVLKAKSYLSMTAFSRQGLIEQLEYEGFTHEQAEYAASAVGY